DVVINEIAWAGTTDNSNDEWIELYNNTNQSIDLSGWYIEDDGVPSYTIASGSIAPRGYFLIEDAEEAVSSVNSDAVIGLSLANAGDSLILKNPSGSVVDSVNSSGGAWYAGDGTSKATMERIDPTVFADTATNWANAKSTNGATGRSNSSIIGTPKGANSNFSGGTKVLLNASETSLNTGESFTVSVKVERVVDLYAYGFEVNYDPDVLNFVSAVESNFLKADEIETGFSSALENETPGRLIVGNARLQNPASGVDGSGELFSVTFTAVGSSGTGSEISLGATSFLADTSGDIPTSFVPVDISVGQLVSVTAVGDLSAVEGTAPYSFSISWTAPSGGADNYIVKRQLVNGSFAAIGETATLSFTDNDSVQNGGNIIPNITYKYQVIPVKNGVSGPSSEITISESRGLVGDNDRSGRIDGRDLEHLARSYGSGFGDEEYIPLADTTFDGIIDGSDLIDIGVSFGVKM
ncbi:MAG: lamin tail domain-containing protein, partial [Candidatus Gracilibacteria bacterium]